MRGAAVAQTLEGVSPALPSPGAIGLLRLHLDSPAGAWKLAGECLSPEERQRAARFRFAGDRRRFTAARAGLRRLLGALLGIPAPGVPLEAGPGGKPRLAREALPAVGGDPKPDLRFNLSHSGELAVVAVAVGREVGVDIEALRPVPDALELAARFFSPREAAALAALSGGEREEALFRCWTRKEAFLKALGEGLAGDLAGVEVTLLPGEPARLLAAGEGRDSERWSLRAITPGPRFAGALVAEGAIEAVTWIDEVP